MTEVYYLPLKTAGGTILGHARIADGVAALRLRRPVHGQAVILGEEGTWFGDVQEEIDVRGKLCAVAVLEEGRLLCFAAPQGQSITFSDLQRQLVRTAPEKPLSTPAPNTEVCIPPAVPDCPPPAASVCLGEAAPQVVAAHAMRIPTHAIRKRRKASASRADDAPAITVPVFTPIPQQIPTAPAAMDGDRPAAAAHFSESEVTEDLLLFDERDSLRTDPPSLADSAADSEAFAALLRRAELVFESIEPPQPPFIEVYKHDAAPTEEAWASDGFTKAQSPAMTAAQKSWGQEVDLLLGTRPAEQRMPIENPFPHIFPQAVFHRISGSGVQTHLEGEWQSGGERLRIYAVAGSYSPQPPAHLSGYTRFIRTQQGCYWVRVTGEP